MPYTSLTSYRAWSLLSFFLAPIEASSLIALGRYRHSGSSESGSSNAAKARAREPPHKARYSHRPHRPFSRLGSRKLHCSWRPSGGGAGDRRGTWPARASHGTAAESPGSSSQALSLNVEGEPLMNSTKPFVISDPVTDLAGQADEPHRPVSMKLVQTKWGPFAIPCRRSRKGICSGERSPRRDLS